MNSTDSIKFVSDGFEKAKGGEAIAVYRQVAQLQDSGSLQAKSHYPFGWIIYYALHQSDASEIIPRKKMLLRYLNLNVERPHKLHSMILTEAIRLAKDASDYAYILRKKRVEKEVLSGNRFSLVRFMELWEYRHLRPGDWRRKDKDGITLPSTVEKLITQYVAELTATDTAPQSEFLNILRKAMKEYPDSYNLKSQLADTFLLTSQKTEAIQLLREAVLMAPAKFYLWHRLASLIDTTENLKLKIALLYRGLDAPGEDGYKGKIRLDLAEIWLHAGYPAYSLFELNRIRETCAANGWNLSSRFKDYQSRIPSDTVEADPSRAYKKAIPAADDFIYSALPVTVARKTYHKVGATLPDKYGRNRTKPAAWRATDEKGNNYWFTPVQFGIDENLPVSTELLLKVFQGKVVKAKVRK